MSDEAAKAKYRRAIVLIDQATEILSQACGELCPLVGAIDQWQDCGRVYDEVRALARRLAYSHVRDDVTLERP